MRGTRLPRQSAWRAPPTTNDLAFASRPSRAGHQCEPLGTRLFCYPLQRVRARDGQAARHGLAPAKQEGLIACRSAEKPIDDDPARCRELSCGAARKMILVAWNK